MKYLYLGLFLLLISCGSEENTAASNIDKTTLFQSMSSDKAIPIHIKADLNAILLRKPTPEKYSGLFSYTDNNGKKRSWKAALTPRGNMRNKHCLFPPLKLDVVKADLKAAGFNSTYDDLKMVIPCKDEPIYQDLVLKEYLAYKLYNEVTDLSFRVQLIDMTLEDSKNQLATIKGKAFIIEKDDELAQRLNGRILKPSNASRDALDAKAFDQMCLFQFMIGNTDWYVYNKHNVKLLAAENYSFPVPVPYDFDYAGMVDADYATPHDKIPVKDVKERFYLGPCREKEDLETTFQLFNSKKSSILSTCDNFAKISPSSHQSVSNYIQDFYAILENPKQKEDLVVAHCDRHIKMK